jgi:hypothetical protein
MANRPLQAFRAAFCAFALSHCGDEAAVSPDTRSEVALTQGPSGTTPGPDPLPDPDVGGQTGDDSGSYTLECDQVVLRALGFDEPSTLGFTAREKIALALGAHRLPMSWLAPVRSSDGSLLDYTARASSEVDIDVSLNADAARVTESTDKRTGERCPDILEADVHLRLATADGALDEQIDGALRLEAGFASLRADLPVESIQGSLAFEPPTLDGFEPSGLSVSAAFSRYGNSGSIAQLYGKGAARTGIEGARWPIWEECTFGVTPVLDEQVEPSVESLLRLVRGTAPLTLINADGVSAPAELAVNAVPQTACFMPNLLSSTLDPNAQDLLNVNAELTLSSAALPAPVHLPVLLFGTFTPGASDFALASVSVGLQPCGTAGRYSPQDFVAHCGDWGVDLSGYDGALLEIASELRANEGYALFRIHGSTFPGCSPSPDGLICPEGSDVDFDVTTLGEVRIYFRE